MNYSGTEGKPTIGSERRIEFGGAWRRKGGSRLRKFDKRNIFCSRCSSPAQTNNNENENEHMHGRAHTHTHRRTGANEHTRAHNTGRMRGVGRCDGRKVFRRHGFTLYNNNTRYTVDGCASEHTCVSSGPTVRHTAKPPNYRTQSNGCVEK